MLADPKHGGDFDWQNQDWEQLRTLADRHRLSGYLYLQLQSHPCRAHVPAEVLSHWKRYYVRQWAKNERLMTELATLASNFDQSGDEVLFLKGPLKAFRLYGRLDARAISDIDVLLHRPEQLRRVEAHVIASGYRRASRLLLNDVLTQACTYQLEYWKGDLPLELHWSLQRHPSLRLDGERLWAERETMELESRCYPVLSLEHLTLAQILSLPADLQVGKLTVRTLFELHLMINLAPQNYDWPAWLERRTAEGTRRMSLIAVAAVTRLFDSSGPAHPGQILAPDLVTADPTPLIAALSAPARQTPWQRRRAAFSLYDCSPALSLMWWGLSLPARLLAHPTETRRHLPWT